MAGSAGGTAAAAEQLDSAALWQRITERYDAAQRDAAATMTETNVGKCCSWAGSCMGVGRRHEKAGEARPHRCNFPAPLRPPAEVVPDGGIQFVLRVAAKLREKPKAPADSGRQGGWADLHTPPQQLAAVRFLALHAPTRAAATCWAHGAGSGQARKEWRNPFLPYDPALWVADLGGGLGARRAASGGPMQCWAAVA